MHYPSNPKRLISPSLTALRKVTDVPWQTSLDPLVPANRKRVPFLQAPPISTRLLLCHNPFYQQITQQTSNLDKSYHTCYHDFVHIFKFFARNTRGADLWKHLLRSKTMQYNSTEMPCTRKSAFFSVCMKNTISFAFKSCDSNLDGVSYLLHVLICQNIHADEDRLRRRL